MDVELNLETTPDIDVPEDGGSVSDGERCRRRGMGLELGKIKVNVKHAPYPDVS